MTAPTLIALLEQAIADPFCRRREQDCFVLSEPDPNQKDYHLRAGVPCFGMTLDLPTQKPNIDAALPFLRRDWVSLTCKCDLIIFVPRADAATVVFLVELKSLNETGYLLQLRASREFARYISELLRLHGLAGPEWEFRGVLIKTRRIPAKGTTRAAQVTFERRNDLEVCEWDRSRPLSLSDLLRAM